MARLISARQSSVIAEEKAAAAIPEDESRAMDKLAAFIRTAWDQAG